MGTVPAFNLNHRIASFHGLSSFATVSCRQQVESIAYLTFPQSLNSSAINRLTKHINLLNFQAHLQLHSTFYILHIRFVEFLFMIQMECPAFRYRLEIHQKSISLFAKPLSVKVPIFQIIICDGRNSGKQRCQFCRKR